MTSWESAPQPVGKSRWPLPPRSAWPDSDLLALGADLEPSTVIDGYRRGMFPMGVSELGDRLGWWSPDPRGILPLDGLRVTRSMRQSGNCASKQNSIFPLHLQDSPNFARNC